MVPDPSQDQVGQHAAGVGSTVTGGLGVWGQRRRQEQMLAAVREAALRAAQRDWMAEEFRRMGYPHEAQRFVELVNTHGGARVPQGEPE
ncbi:hypothetical protein [Nonomuraea sp. SYSU D8015]|uniref:hypothetical protein n=1 Tax=Nonomuraea sp. SYSU D8015 TaxID=2593644 RepID=UPI001661751F|nr:hypothetical protein [Nonomuraea sp. SYSU D8015]